MVLHNTVVIFFAETSLVPRTTRVECALPFYDHKKERMMVAIGTLLTALASSTSSL
jgi:hypothetical protein